MKAEIIKRCMHCNESFTSKRNDRKYCNDTCRQMAYFKRNGLSLSGVQSTKLDKENTTPADDLTQIPTECNSSLYVKDVNEQENAQNVKYASQEPVEDQAIESLVNRLSNLMEQRFAQHIEKLKHEFDVKYASCENNFTAQQKAIENKKECQEDLIENNHLEEDYQWLTSRFLKHIENKFLSDNDSHKLAEPSNYWTYQYIPKIRWVNLRLRCLLESLIKLSNYSRIDKHTLLCVQDAFECLLKSNTYKDLPDNYPYKTLILELSGKINDLSLANTHTTILVFRLPPKIKANMIYIRHEMLKHVPAMKFSEINFEEEPSDYYIKAA